MKIAQFHNFNKTKLLKSIISFVLVFAVLATVVILPASAADSSDPPDVRTTLYVIRGVDSTAFSYSTNNLLLFGPYYGVVGNGSSNISSRLWFVPTNNSSSNVAFSYAQQNFISLKKNEKVTFRLHLELNNNPFSTKQDWSSSVNISAYTGLTLFSFGTINSISNSSHTISQDPLYPGVSGPFLVSEIEFEVSFTNTTDNVVSINSLHIDINGVKSMFVRRSSLTAITSNDTDTSFWLTVKNGLSNVLSYMGNNLSKWIDLQSWLNPLSFLNPMYTIVSDISHIFLGEWDQTVFGHIVTDIKSIFDGNFNNTTLGRTLTAIKTGVSNFGDFASGDLTFSQFANTVMSALGRPNSSFSPYYQLSDLVSTASNLYSLTTFFDSAIPNNYTNVLYSSPNWR